MTHDPLEPALPPGGSEVMDKDAMAARVLARPADATDAGTGLYTPAYFTCILTRELRRSRRTGEPLTVGIAQIDAGDAGDPAATEAGRVISRRIREIDAAAHLGGGLFALLLSRTGAEPARAAGERIRTFLEESSAGRLTLSIGLAAFPDDGLEDEVVVTRAAEAMLHAAGAGGNQVFCFEKTHRQPAVTRARVLIVDDDTRNIRLLTAQLAPNNFELVSATTGKEALEVVRGVDVDLVILDVMMPGMDGFEACRRIKTSEATRQVPVILLTALDDADARLKGIEAGADDFISKPANREELLARTRSLVKMKRLNRNLVSLENALISLANAVEAKDNYTLGHTQRVSTLAVSLGAAMGLDDLDLQALRLGGILHDVGKIGVPEAVLNKPGPLTEEEWALMKSHAELGYKICLPLMESIGPALDVIRHHHEKLDGSSYPDGLKGSGVSLMARIMAVVDCYDAMVTDRPYRAGMSREKAMGILREDCDKGRLDPKVVEVLEGLVTVRGEAAGG
jgi:putative two-component system response regulator